jgi:uncharacterized protein (DUF2267 family)
MPIPMEYCLAAQHFEEFLAATAAAAGLVTRNQAYTTLEGVFRAFRRRLSLEDAIAFAQVLPPLLRALFVDDWDPAEPRADSWDRAVLAQEVQRLRPNHNFAPDTAIRDVADVLRQYVDRQAFETCLARLPPSARDYWSGSVRE